MTKKEMFNEVIALATANDRQDLVEFAEKEIALLAKRNSKSDKVLAKRETEKRELEDAVMEVMLESSNPLRTMEIAKKMGISPQKATPVLARLVKAGKLEVDKVKGVNVYTVSLDEDVIEDEDEEAEVA